MSVRNQFTHNELEEFFRSLQDLLLLSPNPSLSFDSAEFHSRRSQRKQPSFFAPGPSGVSRLFTTPRRFRKNSDRFVFKTTRFVLNWSEVQLLPDPLIYCQSTKATLRGLILFYFARGGGGTTFNRQSGCCEIRCSMTRPPENRYFRRFVGSTS